MRIEAILFDKDGTLFDFGATWNGWGAAVIERVAEGDARLAARVAEALRYDLTVREFRADSPVIAGTNREAAELVAGALGTGRVARIEALMTDLAAEAALAPAVPLAPLCDALAARGLPLGVMTNDAEASARAHLAGAGVLDRFAFVAGFDSGHGAKPDPAPLLAFARFVGVAPGRVAMVGDSLHDLIAGRAAGMATVGVLTGPAPEAELAAHADVVLRDIGRIPDWLDGLEAAEG